MNLADFIEKLSGENIISINRGFESLLKIGGGSDLSFVTEDIKNAEIGYWGIDDDGSIWVNLESEKAE
ncbi:MAG: hypothetical protein L0F96_02515 [Lactococcus lactis]|nr:hypothetical protein [Lactococcus lactis]MDN5473934.1 hypothetical protein [Lactococcus lactis]